MRSEMGGKVASPDSCRKGLREASARRALADRLRDEAISDLADWSRASRKQGLTVTEIAEIIGVTRPTVYALLG